MDSGAYLAWRHHKTIDVAAYCTFLHANRYIHTYINVDEINPRDPEESGLRSFQNFLKMRQRGLDPMPVFHVRETWVDISILVARISAWLAHHQEEKLNRITNSVSRSLRTAAASQRFMPLVTAFERDCDAIHSIPPMARFGYYAACATPASRVWPKPMMT